MSRIAAHFLTIALAIAPAWAGEFGSIGVFVQLQFSPNGSYVLAQDDTDISVLAIEPLHLIFRAKADHTVLGRFTPDSRELVFVSSTTQIDSTQIKIGSANPQVERWNVRDGVRVSSAVIPSLVCGTSALAPDGRTFVCDDLKGNLHVVDVPSGKEVFKKRKFALPYSDPKYEIVYSGKLGAADLEFSPDGRFLIAAPKDEGAAVIWDSREGSHVKAAGYLKLLSSLDKRAYFFTFRGNDQLVMVRARYAPKTVMSECKALTVGFPSGNVIASQRMPMCPSVSFYSEGSTANRGFRSADDARFLITIFEEWLGKPGRSPNPWSARLSHGGVANSYGLSSNAPRGGDVQLYTRAVELGTGHMIPSCSRAMDVFQNRYVEEIRPGVVGLRNVGAAGEATVTVSGR
ncbi:MAG TPA: WD40 repeat domain-containing protein [Bryobacteraceae bacterium]